MNYSNPIWIFPTTFDGGGIGFNDGGTQIFKNASIQSLAREVCQNSIDAKEEEVSLPVEVEFSTFYITKEEFPGYSCFFDVITEEEKYCKDFYKNNTDALNYYSSAKKTLLSDKILCLRVSDFNTTGLTSKNDSRNNNWVNMVVRTGVNDKKPEDGGSFGLGKNAMYACSKFGSLYFSTYTNEEIKRSECVAKLSCYENNDGKIIHGLGFYGNYSYNESNMKDRPINSLCRIDKNFFRRDTEHGTDIFILGFELEDNDLLNSESSDFSKFETTIASAIIDTYFVSVLEEKLVVRINNMLIDKDSIYEIFQKIYNSNKNIFNKNTIDYLQIMLELKDNVFEFPISVMEENENDAVLKIALHPNYHNKVAMVRNTGMKIFDKGNFSQITIFSGVLILKTNEVNGYFKKMENPEHDYWVIDRIKADKKAKERYDRMLHQIKEIIYNLAQQSIPESINVVGLGEFLPNNLDSDSGDKKKEDITNDLLENVEVIERKNLPSDDKGTKDKEGNDEDVSNKGVLDENGDFEGKYNGGKNNTSSGGNWKTDNASVGDGKIFINKDSYRSDVKKRPFYDFEKNVYYLYIQSPVDMENCKIVIQLSGEQSTFTPHIKYAYVLNGMDQKKQLIVDENKMDVGKIIRKSKIKIGFSLEDAENCPLEVSVYEN